MIRMNSINKSWSVASLIPKSRSWNIFLTAALVALMAVSSIAKDHGNGNGNDNSQGNGNSHGKGNGNGNGNGNGQGNENGQGNGNGEGNGEGRNHRTQIADDYLQVNLVSDLDGVAMLQDTNLVNAWGISFSSTSPFWISANGTGKALLYSVTNDMNGNMVVTKQGLEVTIPGDGTPSGQVFNGTGGFNGDVFLFVSEDGTISGWRQSLGTDAEVLTSRDSAVYKGVTLAETNGVPILLAANFAEATVDMYDTNATLMGQFMDQDAPSGYAPFNVQVLQGTVFVTYAKQDDKKHDDVAGAGNGLIDVFNPDSGNFDRLVTGSDAGGTFTEINSPWGLATSPSSFGVHADQLLVGNFGSGTIMTFDDHANFNGLLKGTDEHPIVIDGLWALTFGNGGKAGTPDTLFFSAGPNSEGDGLFGSIVPVEEEHHKHHD
jgi:uncharacterized protein (TIGR03118 family)